MVRPWSDIDASYLRKFANDPFQATYDSIGTLAAEIERTWLKDQLFGWTSMHDLCIQQTSHQPYTRPYIRISPLPSGKTDFRFIDTPIADRQWHRVVLADAAIWQFVDVINELKWVEGVEYLGEPGTSAGIRQHRTSTLPLIYKFISVEMIRDGGSMAINFENEAGQIYMLFMRIDLITLGPDELQKAHAGYHAPILIDCDLQKRPPNKDGEFYSQFWGPKMQVSWDYARETVRESVKLAGELRPVEADWIRRMEEIADGDGARPGDLPKMRVWKRGLSQ